MKKIGIVLLLAISLFMGIENIGEIGNVSSDNTKVNIGQIAGASDEKGISILSIHFDA